MPVSKKSLAAAVAMALSLANLAGGCKPDEDENAVSSRRVDEATVGVKGPSRIREVKAEEGTFPMGIDLPGRVVIPDKDLYTLSARVSGRIEGLSAAPGDEVKAGQVIGHLWSPDLATAAEELKIARKQGGTLVNLTLEKLHAMGLDPRDVSEGVSNFPIRAPIGGVILERKLNSGTAINPGDTILTIARLGSYQFHGEIAPAQAAGVRPGMAVTFEDTPDVRAKVLAVSPVADPVSRLVKIKCAFDGKLPRAIPQETFLKATIVTSEKTALQVPARALVYNDNAEFIFIQSPTALKPDEKPGNKEVFYRRVKVNVISRTKTLLSLEPDAEVHSGTTVVGEGALFLNDVLSGDG